MHGSHILIVTQKISFIILHYALNQSSWFYTPFAKPKKKKKKKKKKSKGKAKGKYFDFVDDVVLASKNTKII